MSRREADHDGARACGAVALFLVVGAPVAAGYGGESALGLPLPGIDAAEVRTFEAGLARFLQVRRPADGLGPAFNATSCAACHNNPTIGGVGNPAVLHAVLPNGRAGGSTTIVHSFSIPDHRCQPWVPSDAVALVRRIPTPLFGAGLIEAIPDETIRKLEDPNDRNGDGIRGRAAPVMDAASGTRRVGRFGWKAQHATLLEFSAEAFRDEMGITNELFRDEIGIGLTTRRLASCDAMPDPEDRRDPESGRRGIDELADFARLLAPLPQGAASPAASAGGALFVRVGCAACHVPVLTTGPSSSAPFDRKPVPLFSDLLLHDIGTGDGLAQGAAGPNEMRTAPLWGLRWRRLLLHDGSALTPLQAIERHRGEADVVRARFFALAEGDRQALLEFLSSL